jgi:hypothetical protein
LRRRFAHLKEFGRWHRELFLASLATAGVEGVVLKKVEFAFGAPRFDTATDPVLSSMTIARWDLVGMLMRVGNVLDLDRSWPRAISTSVRPWPVACCTGPSARC